MPEEAQTTQTTQPTETTTQAAETYNEATGRTNVDDSAFLPEGENGAEGQTEVILSKAGEEESQQTTTQPTEATTTTPVTETGKPAPTTETLLAGKYKTADDLKSAFVQLGGDPSKYDTTEKLVEAYQVRQQEYNRFKAEQDAREQREREQAQRQQQPVEKTPEQLAQEVIGKLNFGKIENVQDLVTQLLPALIGSMPKPQQVDPNQLFTQFEQQSKEREQKAVALAQLEKDVPRLAMKEDPENPGKMIPADPNFRKAFAGFLIAGNYPRNVIGLQTAMKDFLTVTQPGQAPQTTENKNSAAEAQETAGQQSTTKKNQDKDEADEIIDAFKENQAKYAM